MPDNSITVVGNVTQDPELKFTNSGMAQVKLSIAVNRKVKEVETTSFFNIVAWGSLAENVANSLHKGNRVIVAGRLEQRTWETDKGEKRNTVEIIADEIAPSLRWATAAVTKNPRAEGSNFQPRAAAPAAAGTPNYAFDEEPF